MQVNKFKSTPCNVGLTYTADVADCWSAVDVASHRLPIRSSERTLSDRRVSMGKTDCIYWNYLPLLCFVLLADDVNSAAGGDDGRVLVMTETFCSTSAKQWVVVRLYRRYIKYYYYT